VRDYEHAPDECLAADGYLTARPDVHGDGCFCTFTEVVEADDLEPSEDALLSHRYGEDR
jgi:hypothetical protein